MRICFVFDTLTVGGTETLILRMSRWLVRHGHQIVVFVRDGGKVGDSLRPDVQVAVDPAGYNAILFGGEPAARRVLNGSLKGRKIDVFYALSSDALWVTAALLNAQGTPCRLLAGVYYVGAYHLNSALRRMPAFASFVAPASVLFQFKLKPVCRIYMNEAVKQHLEGSRMGSVPGTIWPLPVDLAPFRRVERRPEWGTILSVGRLAPMKEYNLSMVDVVAELAAEGFDVRWVVYGDGPFSEKMNDRVRHVGVQNRVELRGTTPYERLPEAFCSPYLFVGMGTTLIEAAAAGVPAVVARTYDISGLSYGLVQNLPEYSCGEWVDRAVQPIKEIIKRILVADEPEYLKMAEEGREHVGRFDLEKLMPRFLGIVQTAPELMHVWRPNGRYMFARTFERAMAAFMMMRRGLCKAVRALRKLLKLNNISDPTASPSQVRLPRAGTR